MAGGSKKKSRKTKGAAAGSKSYYFGRFRRVDINSIAVYALKKIDY